MIRHEQAEKSLTKILNKGDQSMSPQIGSIDIMIDGPETVQLTLIILQTKTQIKQIHTERSLTKMDADSVNDG